MSGRIKSKLTYANVMATIAVFIALGGASYAALHLPKNSVKSKNIVNGQVKGADVRESSLAPVPQARSVQGVEIKHLSYRAPAGTGSTIVLKDFRGLTLRASCDSGGLLHMVAHTSVNGAQVTLSDWAKPYYISPFNSSSDLNITDTYSNVVDLLHLGYSTPDGADVTAGFHWSAIGVFEGGNGCFVGGYAEG